MKLVPLLTSFAALALLPAARAAQHLSAYKSVAVHTAPPSPALLRADRVITVQQCQHEAFLLMNALNLSTVLCIINSFSIQKNNFFDGR